MADTNDELRDKITALVFEWHQEVSKLPRGETISFYKDKEVMELIAAYSHQRELEAREDEARILHNNLDHYFNIIERIQPGYKGDTTIDVKSLQKVLCDHRNELEAQLTQVAQPQKREEEHDPSI